MLSSSAGFSLWGCFLARTKLHRLKPALLVGPRQRGKLYAAADGVDAFGADTDAVAEFPDVAGGGASAAGLFLLPLFVGRGPRNMPAAGNDGVVLLAIENVFAGKFRD